MEEGWLKEATARLVSSPHCCVAIETSDGDVCYVFFVCLFVSREKQTGSNDGGKRQKRGENTERQKEIFADVLF